MKIKYKIGDIVKLTKEARVNYGDKWEYRVLVISSISTKYMPAKQFYYLGKPSGFHPGFDESMNEPLYEFNVCNLALYQYEITEA